MTDYTASFNDRELDIILGGLESYYKERIIALSQWKPPSGMAKLHEMYLKEIGQLQDKIIYALDDTT